METKMNFRKILWIALGCTSLGLGSIGTILPMLPTVPFFMLAAISFAKSSQKLHNWFVGTKLYKDNLEDYVLKRGMTRKCKMRIMAAVTLLMAFGFVTMGAKGIITGCVMLGLIWILHIFYFCFGVKTISGKEVL